MQIFSDRAHSTACSKLNINFSQKHITLTHTKLPDGTETALAYTVFERTRSKTPNPYDVLTATLNNQSVYIFSVIIKLL